MTGKNQKTNRRRWYPGATKERKMNTMKNIDHPEVRAYIDEKHNVYTDGDYFNHQKDAETGWQPIPGEWLYPERWDELDIFGYDHSDLVQCEVYPLISAALDGNDLSAECPHCGQMDGYVSTGEHAAHGQDAVHCTGCGKIFRIEW
jgi:hypothetical protein